MKRKLLVLAIGISFLIIMTWLGTIFTEIIPRHPSPQTQTTQAGPYQLTLQVIPNPPRITQPAMLSVLIVQKETRQPITNALVTIESTMETMDMGTDHTTAQSQYNGFYRASTQFSMSGRWRVQVLITVPNNNPEQATFEVTAQ